MAIMAQEESIEDWLGDGASESTAAEMSDELLHLMDNPVNINDTSAMASLPYISPFQHRALRNYIMLYGQLVSLKELAFVPGFDSTTIALIEPLVRVAPYADDHTFKPWQGHHTLVTGIGGTIEQSEGYRNGRYEGDNIRALLCYTYNYRNRIDIRLTADKDPTEAWGQDNYLGYHIMLSDIGRLKRLIVGHYNLQFGQGLALWTGMAPFNITGVSPMRFGQGIKPAGAFYEDDYLNGVAATVDVGRGVSTTAFASRVDGNNLFGGRIGFRRGNFIAGVTTAYSLLDDSVTMYNYLYNTHYFRGKHLLNVGADVMWQWRRITLYGEAAMAGDSCTVAVAAGALVQANNRNRFGVSIRHFDEAYHNLHAQAYAIGHTMNESGVALDAITCLPLKVNATISLDLHSFPAPRYGAYTPTSGQWLRMKLDRQFGRNIIATLRYAYRYKERNIPNIDSAVYLGEGTLRQQAQAEIRATLGKWIVTTRGIACHFGTESGIRQAGWVAGASARYTYRSLQATAAAAWFDVDGYYARIYLSESNLQYSWSMPALNGRGLRASAVLRYSLTNRINFAAKYTITIIPDQETIGSGDSQTKGNHRQTWHLQLRLKL